MTVILLLVLWDCFVCLNSQTLEEAITKAMTCHPEILQNQMQQNAAREEMLEARGAYYPTIDFNGSYGREETESVFTQDLEGIDSITLNRKEFSGSLTQNIFSGGGVEGEFQRNKFNYLSIKFNKLAKANDIALDVIQAYLNVRLQEKLIVLGKRNLKRHEDLYTLTEERATAGISRAADVNQAKARVNLARVNLINSEGNYREAQVSFKKVVGIKPVHLTMPTYPDKSKLPPNVKNAIEIAKRAHPLIKSATTDIKEAKAQQKVANAQFFPKVDAVVSFSRNRNLDGLEGINNDNLAAVRVSYNAFRGGADTARYRKTAYQVQEAIQIRNNTLIDIIEIIGLAYNAWQTNLERKDELKHYVKNVQKTSDAYFEQYKIGKRTLLDLLNVQNELYKAHLDLLTAENDEVFARYRILNSTGLLLPYFAQFKR